MLPQAFNPSFMYTMSPAWIDAVGGDIKDALGLLSNRNLDVLLWANQGTRQKTKFSMSSMKDLQIEMI